MKVSILLKPTDPHTERATLSIGDVVAALAADFPEVSRSSLRFLEREGLIRAKRTPGGHRLYSPADVDRIRQIKLWQAQRRSLQQIRERLADLDHMPVASALAERFLTLAVEGNRSAAHALILSADDVGMPLLRVFGEVLQPALYKAGRQWERGELTVAHEKEISELTRELITELTNRHLPADSHKPVIIAAGVEGERHELGLRMISGLLRTVGYQVHYVGADVAPRFLVEAVQLRQPDAVLLSVTLESHLCAVRDAVTAIRASRDGATFPCILTGGVAVVSKSIQIAEWGAIPVVDGDLASVIAEIERLIPCRISTAPGPAVEQ